MQLILAHVFKRQPVGRLAKVLAEVRNSADVGFCVLADMLRIAISPIIRWRNGSDVLGHEILLSMRCTNVRSSQTG